jgi:hypothetical protein
MGCLALGNLAYDLSERVRKATGAIGAVETVVKGMHAFPESENMQYYSTVAIDNLLVSCKDNAERFVNVNGIDSVFAAMTNFPAHKRIQERGCGIVQICIKLLENQDQWIDHDAFAVVGKVLKKHRVDEDIKKWARHVLTALARGD